MNHTLNTKSATATKVDRGVNNDVKSDRHVFFFSFAISIIHYVIVYTAIQTQ